MKHPFELTEEELEARLDEMVGVTFADLQSQFLVLPRGSGFIEYADFQSAYEVLKRETGAFATFTNESIWRALRADALSFVVLRTIIGLSPPEWAEIARSEHNVDANQGFARTLDAKVRTQRNYFRKVSSVVAPRVEAMVATAVKYLAAGAPQPAEGTVHRLDKTDTAKGIPSIQHAANYHVPYSVLLYERFLGRPFASHRDSVSELVGDVMESAVEVQLSERKISFRKTKRAELIPGFEQAPDFFVPDEFSPSVIIEAKITSDDGTARDKVSRILRLAAMRDQRIREGRPSFEVVACVDGRGFGQRRRDMQQMLKATNGKVFTLNTLNKMVDWTGLAKFLPRDTAVGRQGT